MNILVFNWQDIRNPLGGGAEVHFHEIFKRIAARGHTVTLFCSRFAGAKREEVIDGIQILREGGRNLFNLYVPFRYWRTLRRNGYDVVVDDVNKIPFFSPLFVRRPLVGILHHLFGKSIFTEASLPAALYVSMSERLASIVYRKIPMAVVSESTANELEALGFQRGRLFQVPNCVDRNLYRPPSGQQQGDPIIGYLGRLKKYKCVEDLLYAFEIVLKEAPKARLQVIGEGDAREKLERIAQETGIAERVDFLGYVSQQEKVRFLQGMQFVVNTSSKEGWGLTVIEANACGVPVIASDVPGLRDSVQDGKSGFLYEFGNVEQLAQKMLLLLRDARLRAELSAGAIRWAETFNWDHSAEKMLAVLEGAIRGEGSGSSTLSQ